MKKAVIVLIIGTVLVFSIFAGGGNEKSTVDLNYWEEISSSEKLVGKWEGYNNIPIPPNYDSRIPNTSIDLFTSLNYKNDSENVNFKIKWDMNKFLADWSNELQKIRGSFSKDYLWEELVKEFKKDSEFKIGDDFSITTDITDNPDGFFPKNSKKDKAYISKDGNEILLLFNRTITLGLGDKGIKEIILKKI